eukprot:6414149-Amphidinium_carterae.1
MMSLKKARSQELSDVMGPTVHTLRLSNEIEVRLTSHSSATKNREIPINSCNSYLMGLRILLFTMAEAGCFKAVVNDVETPFSSLELLVTHMAWAEPYVLRYSSHMPEH